MRLWTRVLIGILFCTAGTRAGDVQAPGDLAESVFALALEADPQTDIDAARAQFQRLTENAAARLVGASDLEKVDLLAQVLAEEGFVAAENGRRRGSMLLPAVLETRRGNCMGFSLLYACLAQRLGISLNVALIPEHAFIACGPQSHQHYVETLTRGTRYDSFKDFLQARAEIAPPYAFRVERPAADSVGEALRMDQRLQSRDGLLSQKPALLKSSPEILALLLTQVAGELDAPADSTLRLEFCARATALHPHLAVAQESWGHFLHQKSGLSAAREKLLTASTLQQEQGWLQSALRTAAAAGSAERVRELIRKGAPVKARDGQGRAALHFASTADCVNRLLQAGAEPLATTHDGQSALHFAARFGADDALNALLVAGLKVSLADSYGRTPLHYAALYDRERGVERLLRGGASPDELSASGATALHLAAQAGATQSITVLLRAGASVTQKNSSAATALNIAAAHGRTDAARLLLDAGSAASEADGDGVTPLHWAARRGNTPLVKLLLERGAIVDAIDRDGRTALIFNAFAENIESARLLLEHGTPVNATSRLKRTALHHAAYFNNLPLMRLLLSHGADRDAADVYGRTPFDYCNSASREALNP